ncbi:haloacid dehalogenase type II [Priestia megaterium]|nr:haloacid dehalogenase type II [Priestia megaterium]
MKFKAILFDTYGTLFDVHTVVKICNELYPGKGEQISYLWRLKQVEYAMQSQLMGRYADFYQLTNQSLKYAVEASGFTLTDEAERILMDTYLKLNVYRETKQVLAYLKEKGYILAIFTNGPKQMIAPLLAHHRLNHLFDDVISVDEIKQYKPAMASYHYATNKLGINREQILFLSSNTWDVAGAKNYGFSTAWVNRKGNVIEHPDLAPDVVIQDLTQLIKK